MTGGCEHAVLVHLKGAHQPDDLAALEDTLIAALNKLRVGEFDGNEIGPNQTTLYLYGSDADLLFSAVERTLTENPLSQEAQVILRYGGPGSPQKEVSMIRRDRPN